MTLDYSTSRDIQVQRQSPAGSAGAWWSPRTAPVAVGQGVQIIALIVSESATSPSPARVVDMPPVVEVPTIGKAASGIVFIICILSLLVGLLSGFNMIYAPMAILIAWFAAVYYFMSARIVKKWKR